jgi:AraC-like DNA-binding protein
VALSARDRHQIIRDMSNRRAPRARPSRTPPARVAQVRLSPLRGIPVLLDSFGVPSGPLLRAARIRPEDFEDPFHSEPFDRLDRLLGACVSRTGCEHFGLLLSQHVDLAAFGIIGRLARHSTSVGEALAELTRYFSLHDSGGSIGLSVKGDLAILGYGIHVPGVRNADQIYDLSVAAMCGILRELCGPDWRPVVAHLPRRRPADILPYRQIIRAPLRFDSLQAAVAFSVETLARPLPTADAVLHQLLVARAAADSTDADAHFHDEVRRAIRSLLAAGRCSRTATAAHLGMHERTLGRRLQSTGTTFQELLVSTRAEMARQLLQNTRLSVARVAAALGFSDATAFTRAFRAWSGVTPSAFRSLASGR